MTTERHIGSIDRSDRLEVEEEKDEKESRVSLYFHRQLNSKLITTKFEAEFSAVLF
jgi:hypothetical protein